GVREEDAAGLGAADPAGGALEQLRAGLALERRHLAGHRRLGVAQALGRGRDRALPGDLAEDAQTRGVEHARSLCQAREKIICAHTVGAQRSIDADPPSLPPERARRGAPGRPPPTDRRLARRQPTARTATGRQPAISPSSARAMTSRWISAV